MFSFTDIRIGDKETPDVEVERFRAEVELAPLLKGQVRILQVSVERPRMRIDVAGLAGEGAAGLERRWQIEPERISLARLQVAEGTAIIEDSRNRKELAGHRYRRRGRGELADGPRADIRELRPRRNADQHEGELRPVRNR